MLNPFQQRCFDRLTFIQRVVYDPDGAFQKARQAGVGRPSSDQSLASGLKSLPLFDGVLIRHLSCQHGHGV